MEEFFKNKYRVATARLTEWDYSTPGYYFITICTDGHRCCFGEVRNKIMGLSEAGLIAHGFWLEIPNHFENTNIDKFVIMPNHVHGILQIFNTIKSNDRNFVNAKIGNLDYDRRDAIYRVSTTSFADMDAPANWDKNKFGPLRPNSVATIIGCYKAAVTRFCKLHGLADFNWQERFHDRIIRDEKELENKRKYILDNPSNWERDKNNPKNIKS